MSSLLAASMLLAGQAAPAFTTDMLVVLGIVALALVLFITERLPIDLTALLLMVLVIVLSPWTRVSPQDGISGFASTATITVLAMFVLSEGIRRTGLLQRLSERIVGWTGPHLLRQLTAVIGLSGASGAIINNTPVVAMLIPVVMNLARRTKTSPSKLLIPLSYATMMGGMLTLIGTSTNILASDVSARLLGHPFSMFEFTALGAIVLGVGSLYLLFVGRHLLPERIKPEDDLTEEFEMSGYLTQVVVRENASLRDRTVARLKARLGLDFDIVQLTRRGETFTAPLDNKEVRPGDVLLLRADRNVLGLLIETQGFEPVDKAKLTDQNLVRSAPNDPLIELVLLSDNPLVGETLRSINFAQRYGAYVLSIRRREDVIHDDLDDVVLEGGDTLLVQASARALDRFTQNRTFVVIRANGDAEAPFRRDRTAVAIGIVAGVVGLAALEIVDIVVAALLGVLAMILTGCLKPTELYQAVDWRVIFLLAGLIPLGMAIERSGTAAYLAYLMASGAHTLSPFMMLLVFYVVTTLLTEIISNNASVVLMIPVAVETAQLTGADPFSFVLAVTFAASCAMLTPVGYQTNLMVYGPGGYRFTDFFRVGAILQVLLALVTCAGIVLIWGV